MGRVTSVCWCGVELRVLGVMLWGCSVPPYEGLSDFTVLF